LHEYIDQIPGSSPRVLWAQLEAWIDAAVRAEFERMAPRFEAEVVGELTQLEGHHAARMQEILEGVQAVAEDVFGVPAGELLPDLGVRASSRFSYKLADVENALDMLVGLGRTIAPGRLGRRFVIRNAEQRLIAMIDRHAGRLRSELADRMIAATREYRRELAGAVADAITAIRGALDRAIEDRRRGEQQALARLDELAEVERRCQQLTTDGR